MTSLFDLDETPERDAFLRRAEAYARGPGVCFLAPRSLDHAPHPRIHNSRVSLRDVGINITGRPVSRAE